MPEMEVDRNKLLSQIKEAHGKVMYPDVHPYYRDG